MPSEDVRRSPLARAALGVAGLAAIAVLIALGTWQVQRLAWKSALIARVEQRVHADPVPAPGPPQWPSVTADDDEYRRVHVTGRLLPGRDTRVLAVTVHGGGYWLMTPLRRDDGSIVLINRGFVPPDFHDPASGTEPAPETSVTGLLRISEPGGALLRHNDPLDDRWYSRDVAAIAAARGLTEVAPYFVDAEATSSGSPWPAGGLTVTDFPNNHLVYAITWYALAAALAGAMVWVVREEMRPRRAGNPQ